MPDTAVKTMTRACRWFGHRFVYATYHDPDGRLTGLVSWCVRSGCDEVVHGIAEQTR